MNTDSAEVKTSLEPSPHETFILDAIANFILFYVSNAQ